MKTTLCSLVTLLACASACTADLALHTGGGVDVETPPEGEDAGREASWIGPAIEGAARRDAGSDSAASPWQADPDAAAPRPGDLWGASMFSEMEELAVDDESLAPCYVRKDGAVMCWGENGDGQLGNGSFGGVNGAPVREDELVEVQGLRGAVSMVATPRSRCALTDEGDVWCWGTAGYFHSAIPVRVLGIDGQAVGLTSYRDEYEPHILAVMRSGQVQEIELWLALPEYPPEASLRISGSAPSESWAIDPYTGWYFVNAEKQLLRNLVFIEVDDDPRAAELDPFPIPNVERVHVEQGPDGAGLALLEDGRVACWGACPLADPATLTRTSWRDAVVIPGLERVRALLGSRCVVDESDIVWCWGADIFASRPGLYTTPARAGYLPDVKALFHDASGRPVQGLSNAGELRKLVWP